MVLARLFVIYSGTIDVLGYVINERPPHAASKHDWHFGSSSKPQCFDGLLFVTGSSASWSCGSNSQLHWGTHSPRVCIDFLDCLQSRIDWDDCYDTATWYFFHTNSVHSNQPFHWDVHSRTPPNCLRNRWWFAFKGWCFITYQSQNHESLGIKSITLATTTRFLMIAPIMWTIILAVRNHCWLSWSFFSLFRIYKCITHPKINNPGWIQNLSSTTGWLIPT